MKIITWLIKSSKPWNCNIDFFLLFVIPSTPQYPLSLLELRKVKRTGNMLKLFPRNTQGGKLSEITQRPMWPMQSGLRNTDGLLAHRRAIIQPTDGLLHWRLKIDNF